MRCVPKAELEQIERRLGHFACVVRERYPNMNFRDRSGSVIEAVRNAETALAHIQEWLAYRSHFRGRDPID